MSDPNNYDSMAFRNPNNWTPVTNSQGQLTEYKYQSPRHTNVTSNAYPKEYAALMGLGRGGSRRRRTVHRKRKSHRKSKRVHHTRIKHTRRHRHRR